MPNVQKDKLSLKATLPVDGSGQVVVNLIFFLFPWKVPSSILPSAFLFAHLFTLPLSWDGSPLPVNASYHSQLPL